MKRGLFCLARVCLLALVQTAVAQIMPGDSFRLDNRALFGGSSVPTLWRNGAFSSGIGFDWTMPVTALPPVLLGTAENSYVAAKSDRRLSDRLGDFLPHLDYATGEVGFLYGHASGKFGGDFWQTYFIGEVGDDKFHIVVGAAYEDSNFRLPKQIR